MLRNLLLCTALALAPAGPAFAQQQSIAPQSAPPPGCQAGTGSLITSVGVTAITVCAASAAGKRVWWRIANNGANELYCTDTGDTPTSSFFTFTVLPGAWTQSGSSMNVSPLAIKCISPNGTTAIYPSAVQSGAP